MHSTFFRIIFSYAFLYKVLLQKCKLSGATSAGLDETKGNSSIMIPYIGNWWSHKPLNLACKMIEIRKSLVYFLVIPGGVFYSMCLFCRSLLPYRSHACPGAKKLPKKVKCTVTTGYWREHQTFSNTKGSQPSAHDSHGNGWYWKPTRERKELPRMLHIAFVITIIAIIIMILKVGAHKCTESPKGGESTYTVYVLYV